MPNEIIIEAPRQGVAQSPHVGFGNIRNLDIDSIPGVAKLNKKMFLESSTTITGTIKWVVRNPSTPTELFALDEDGVLYRSADTGDSWAILIGTSSTAASGNGLHIWKDFLFVARDAFLDVYGPLAGQVFTVTIATPALFTKVAHGLVLNDKIVFATTGALPTGLTAGTTYHIISAGLTADDFEVSATQGGAAINTSGTQSGVHTYKAWDLGFQAIDTDSGAITGWHPMITSKLDSELYGGAGAFIYNLVEDTTFVPGVAATYTWTKQALPLPSDYKVKCLAELGNNLMIGTWQGTNVYNLRVADIFPWDGSSTTYGQPIVLEDYGVHAMLTTGNSIIVLAGITGSIFKCDGANAYRIAELPIDLTARSLYGTIGDKYLEWYPGAIVNYKDKVFFGVGNGADTVEGGIGTYSLQQTSKGSILNLEHTNALLTDGTTVPAKMTALLTISRGRLLQCYKNDDEVIATATYGIELTSATSYAYLTDYAGYFESALFQVGNDKNKWKPSSFTVFLGEPLVASEGVQIQFRTSLTGTFTTVKTMAFADNGIGAIQSKTITIEIPDNIKEAEQLQIKVGLTGAGTTPQFKRLRLS